ncbi:MAG: hypothetical protein WBD99_11850 [Thermodesulfobacteriota bacterium]
MKKTGDGRQETGDRRRETEDRIRGNAPQTHSVLSALLSQVQGPERF